jgi:DNA-binding CsgD family transcriptional regulator
MNLQTLSELQARANLEPEVKLLLRQLLALVDSDISPDAAVGADKAWNFHTGGESQEELVLQFEHGGARYKLLRSTRREPLTSLSPREQEIVQLVSHGYANKTIAHKLAISQHTVNTHVRRIFDKMGVSSRAEMVAYALRSGLVARPDVYYN